MLGVQQTRSAVPHHPTSRSSATAVAAISGQIRTTPKSKRQPSIVQKQLLDTVSPAQEDHEPLAAASTSAEDISAWPGTAQEGGDENREAGAVEQAGQTEVDDEQSKSVGDQVGGDQQKPGRETADQEREGREGNEVDSAENYTRRPSSPLSELSPAPDDDDNPNQEEGGGDGGGNGQDTRTKEQPALEEQMSDSANPVDANATSLSNSFPGLAGSGTLQSTTAAPFSIDSTNIDGLTTSPPPRNSSQLLHSTSTPISPLAPKRPGENAQAGPSSLASSSPSNIGATQKFSILLELNTELFKVCQAFVAAGYVLQETPEAQLFSKKLQSNLTWMSAHVDGVKLATLQEVPEMDPPVLAPSAAHIAFPEGLLERVSNLYSRLPIVFAKDIARRSQKFGSSSGTRTPTLGHRNSSTPTLLPPSGIGVKRERPDSAGYPGHESPSATKRRDTGEGKVAGPSTPVLPGSAGVIEMRPPATPGFPSQSQMQSQMARPSSSLSGVGPLSSGAQALNDGMFRQSSSPGVGVGGNMYGAAGMGRLSPEAQARARQMQMRQMQTQALMFQQQHQQQQHQQQQHQQQNQQQQTRQQSPQANQQRQNMQQQTGMHGGNLSMSPPQRQVQPTPSPTQQQQMMQAQAAAARQMSPPGAASAMNMSIGMNGTDGMGASQQAGMSNNMSQMGMNLNLNGSNAGSHMTLNPQMIANMGPAAMATYQMLQNPQHPMTQFLNQQLPGFSQLPIMDQMRRFQTLQQRQLQHGQRNQQMMANQTMGAQMRPANTNASGSGTSQMQILGQSGHMGMAPQMQSSNSDGGMQFPGTPTSATMNTPGRTGSSMGMSQQVGGMGGIANVPNVANLNPQQRQLYLMQMQMRGAGAAGGGGGGGGGVGAGMNPSMMNPQVLAAAQERQRLEQQRLAMAQRQGSPLNPAASGGRDQFPPGLRSNPAQSVGIARTSRSPSVSGMGDMAGAATPRIGGRMLPGSEDYQRQVLLQQAQRSAQLQHQQQGFMQGQGQGQSGWPGQPPSQQLPLSAGAWPQQHPQGFGMSGSPPNGGMQSVDLMGTPQQTGATPAPMGQHSPTAPSPDFDNMTNW